MGGVGIEQLEKRSVRDDGVRLIQSDGRPVTRPRRVTRLGADLRSRRIPVAIANAVEEVVLSLEMCAPEALTKAVIDALEAAIGRAGNACVERTHATRQAVSSDLDDEVIVVSHQREGEHPPIVRASNTLEDAKEKAAEVVVEDDLLVVATRDDVVVGVALLMTRPARHDSHRRRGRRTGEEVFQSRCIVGAVA